MSSNNNRNKVKQENKSTPINKLTISVAGIFILGFLGLFVYFIGSTTIKTKGYKKGYAIESSDGDEVSAANVDDCVTQCKNDLECNGITFNNVSAKDKNCTKYKKGVLAVSTNDNYGWEKQQSTSSLKSNTVIIGYTKDYIVRKKRNFIIPIRPEFNYTFWLHIDNWNDIGYGIWKNVFHKGTHITKIPKSNNWDHIIDVIPEQSIGVWLSPYTPVLRICVNTNRFIQNQLKQISDKSNGPMYGLIDDETGGNSSSPILESIHPGINESNAAIHESDKLYDGRDMTKKYNQFNNVGNQSQLQKMEWFDITDIPINKLFMVSVNINKNVVEIYLNQKLRYIFYLEQNVEFNMSGDLYAKQSPTFSGSIYNLTYLPTFIKYSKIEQLYSLKPKENT
jgi:hypothetical protein